MRALSFLPPSGIKLRDPSLPTPTLDAVAKDRIGRELRAMYAEFERQPIPPRFRALLSQLQEPRD
jgi:hypothetical protein